MGHWALVKFAVLVLPRGRGREAVLRHIDRCPTCRARLVGMEEARRVLIQAENVGRLDEIWASVDKAMKAKPVPAGRAFERRERRRGSRLLRWAAAAGGIGGAVAVILLALGVLVPRGVDDASGAAPPADSLRIFTASIAGRPAELYVVEAPEDRMIFVWAEKQPEKGELS
jgi:hypothetical protein